MEAKHQVFISSTYADLKEERREVMMALLELGAIPAGMELFQASNDEQFRYITEVIDECDYYVLIVGGRYGSVNDVGVSFTEMEFDYALQKGKPILAFLHSDPAKIAAGDTERTDEGKQKLEAFRRKVTKDRMCKFYSTPAELGGHVSRSFTQAKRRHPAAGWVRASEAGSAEQVATIAELRLRVRELEDQLGELKKASKLDGMLDLDSTFDQMVALRFSFKASPVGGGYGSRLTHYSETRATRRQLFHAVGARMLTPRTEVSMKGSIDRYVGELNIDELAHREEFRDQELTGFAISASDFHVLKTYFYGTGLIRPLSDSPANAPIWELTPAAARLVVQATAISAADDAGEE